ncbi:PREDICTED: uncharacterized protein LOC105143509 isoform X1 [Acromyrmex echinatior]|uniref:uncharacterized protein LOC105143509 isoform X1 n=1 Tax=Acromyrmex echinatior TaxID=103372 RepID=UPI000580C751|nr:PREDICTED: uncharacterized protein LOC105143509 isoform X1 [Acromyrmex echinatior]
MVRQCVAQLCPQPPSSTKDSRDDFSSRQPMTDRASRAKWNPLRLRRHFLRAAGSVTHVRTTYTGDRIHTPSGFIPPSTTTTTTTTTTRLLSTASIDRGRDIFF